MDQPSERHLPRLEIEYCTQCKWLPRASWVSQEILQTFRDRLGEVALVPGTGGVFRILVDAGSGPTLLWDRREAEAGVPDIVELKRQLRDVIASDLDLGHADRHRAER